MARDRSWRRFKTVKATERKDRIVASKVSWIDSEKPWQARRRWKYWRHGGEYFGCRPMSYEPIGKVTKKITHRIERRRHNWSWGHAPVEMPDGT